MGRSRVARSALVAAALLSSVLVAVPAQAAPAATPPGPIYWQSAGDSFSSGEGVDGNTGPCSQSNNAYGPLSAAAIAGRGWDIQTTFTACTGHLVENYFSMNPSTGNQSLWDWGRQQGGPARDDVITMSFGGNDIGFADVLTQCLPIPDNWAEYAAVGTSGVVGEGLVSLAACGISEQELMSRVDALVDPPNVGCPGDGDLSFRGTRYGCKMALDGRRGSIVDFYYDVVTKHLTDRGQLYVVGYPSEFAPTGEWGYANRVSGCWGVKRGDADKLTRVAQHLNDKLAEAVRRVNEVVGGRVHLVDRWASYRDGSHELCGTGEDWLNGVKPDRGTSEFHKEGSFHPNKAGHAATAADLQRVVAETFPRTAPKPKTVHDVDWRNETYPAGTCAAPPSWLSSFPIPVVDGTGSSGDPSAVPEGGFDYAHVGVSPPAGYGDVDGDGRDEAVMGVLCDAGGTSADVIVDVFTGGPGNLGLLGGTSLYVDAASLGVEDYRVSSVALDGRDVLITAAVPGPGGLRAEPRCCYTGSATWRFSWSGSGWDHTRVS